MREVDTLLVERIRQKPREATRDAVKKTKKGYDASVDYLCYSINLYM